MTDISDLAVWTAQDGDKWIAATSRAPYFCFRAESEQAALAIAGRALRFYETASTATKGRARVESKPTFNKKVLGRELAAA